MSIDQPRHEYSVFHPYVFCRWVRFDELIGLADGDYGVPIYQHPAVCDDFIIGRHGQQVIS
jgi:hypothetical protein